MSEIILSWIRVTWHVLSGNIGWMSWNLFLALFPLFISLWLFRPPVNRWFFWVLAFLLGITLLPSFYHVIAYIFHLVRDVGKTYLLGGIILTLSLMFLDFFWLRQLTTRSLGWWFGFFLFISFLPNAPYVLTDVIHLYDNIRSINSVWIITLGIIPQYLLFIILGFQAYVISLINLDYYLEKQGWKKVIFPVELAVHVLCSIGIYLGRFIRFNSWDILVNPDQLVNSIMSDIVGKIPLLVIFITFLIITTLYGIMKLITLSLFSHWQKSQLSPFTPGSFTGHS